MIDVQQKRESYKHDYNLICSLIPEVRKYSYEEYVFASLIILSRVFGIQVHGKSEVAVVPLVDMMNHETEHEVSWGFDDKQDAFVASAVKDIKRG